MKPCAVINSGPLVALSLIGRLDLLSLLFSEFWIPDKVYHEVVVAGLGKPGAAALSEQQWTKHIRVAPEPDPLLIAELDPGEAAVIALARSCSPCLVIIDEKRGRRIAHHVYGLSVKGTAGLLVEAKRRNLIDGDLRTILLGLKRSGYFLSDTVIDRACQAVQEN